MTRRPRWPGWGEAIATWSVASTLMLAGAVVGWGLVGQLLEFVTRLHALGLWNLLAQMGRFFLTQAWPTLVVAGVAVGTVFGMGVLGALVWYLWARPWRNTCGTTFQREERP